jgi:hypothetical protein
MLVMDPCGLKSSADGRVPTFPIGTICRFRALELGVTQC